MIFTRNFIACVCGAALIALAAYTAMPSPVPAADARLASLESSVELTTLLDESQDAAVVQDWEYTASPFFVFFFGRDFDRYGRCRAIPRGPRFNFPGPPDVNPPPWNPIGPGRQPVTVPWRIIFNLTT